MVKETGIFFIRINIYKMIINLAQNLLFKNSNDIYFNIIPIPIFYQIM